jgi:hypothetical protein
MNIKLLIHRTVEEYLNKVYWNERIYNLKSQIENYINN